MQYEARNIILSPKNEKKKKKIRGKRKIKGHSRSSALGKNLWSNFFR